jgi:hypothetical protein
METRLPANQIDAVHRCFKRKHAVDQFYALAVVLLWRNRAVSACLDSVNGPSEGPNGSQLVLPALDRFCRLNGDRR